MTDQTATTTEAQFDEARDFLHGLFAPGDIINFRCISNVEAAIKQKWCVAGDEDSETKTLTWAKQLNSEQGYSVYVGMNPRTEMGGGSAEHVRLFRALAADLDGGVDVDEALSRVKDCGIPEPSAIVSTGGGVHLYWFLDKPLESADVWSTGQKFLITKLRADPVVHDAPRIMRLPGFINRKPRRHEAYVKLYFIDAGRRHRLSEIVPAKPVPAAANVDPTDSQIRGYMQRGDKSATAILTEEILENHRHANLRDLALTLVFTMAEYDKPKAAQLIFGIVNLANRANCKPPHGEAEVRHNVETAIAFRKKKEYAGERIPTDTVKELKQEYEKFFDHQKATGESAKVARQGLEAHGLAKKLNRQCSFIEWMPGDWRLKIINSDPAEVELHVPAWQSTAAKGVIVMSLDDFLKPARVNEAVFKQTLTVLLAQSPQEWSKIWQGCSVPYAQDKNRRVTFTGLASKLVELAEQVETSGASKRFSAVAGLLLQHLGRSAPYEEGQPLMLQENGRGTWISEELLFFRWNEAWASINQSQRVDPQDYRGLKRRLCSALGANDFRTERRRVGDHKLLFTVFTQEWLSALEELACGGPASDVNSAA